MYTGRTTQEESWLLIRNNVSQKTMERDFKSACWKDTSVWDTWILKSCWKVRLWGCKKQQSPFPSTPVYISTHIIRALLPHPHSTHKVISVDHPNIPNKKKKKKEKNCNCQECDMIEKTWNHLYKLWDTIKIAGFLPPCKCHTFLSFW